MADLRLLEVGGTQHVTLPMNVTLEPFKDVNVRLALKHALDREQMLNEIRQYWKRVLKRIDVTSRTLVTLVEPGSCFAGPLLELALACDRQYMLEGARIVLTDANLGAFPMANGLSRLASRFGGDAPEVPDRALDAYEAEAAGLVTLALDDIDWEDEIRIAVEERSSLSPDALTGMEANLRFVGPETMETRIFGRLTAWQNWIFQRPNSVGEQGALKLYGSCVQPSFDRGRV